MGKMFEKLNKSGNITWNRKYLYCKKREKQGYQGCVYFPQQEAFVALCFLRSLYPKSTEHLFDCIDELVKASINEEGVLEVNKLIGAVRINQSVLKTLGVSCEAIDEIVQLAEQHHFAAKLTGGGGGGCVVAIRETACDEDEAALINVLHSRGYQTCVVRLGGEGIHLEQIESTV